VSAEGRDSSNESNKALWEKGDFTRIAESVRERGKALAERCRFCCENQNPRFG
jgi:hypothetical protein